MVFDEMACGVIAAGWALGNKTGGRHLLGAVRAFGAKGFTPVETIDWMGAGLWVYHADQGRRYGVDPQQLLHLYGCTSDADSEVAMSDRLWDDVNDGVPVGLACLLSWAGCTSDDEYGTYFQRWRNGDDIEPGLRLLAALRCPDKPALHPDAPAQYAVPAG